MMRLTLSPLAFVLIVAAAPIAVAAGGGGSAGGAGAQNQPASGLPLGEAGPVGSPNNPRHAQQPQQRDESPIDENGAASLTTKPQ